MTSRRARLVLVLVVLGVVGLGLFVWEPVGDLLWVSITTKRVPMPTSRDGGPWVPSWIPISVNPDVGRGWVRVKRWADPPVAHGTATWYFLSTGYKGQEYSIENGVIVGETTWKSDGSVLSQHRVRDEHGNLVDPYGEKAERRSPPWWWGVTDQTEPSAPWWKEGE